MTKFDMQILNNLHQKVYDDGVVVLYAKQFSHKMRLQDHKREES